MGAKWFKCPDGERIEIARCLANGGCRMLSRCATRPYLRLVSHEREWKGISPSAAGNGPRLIYLRQTTDFCIDPDDRAFMAVGTATHQKLSLGHFTRNVISEEPLSDSEMRGIPDVLEEDEENPRAFILSDYKTWGSYKVMKALGLQSSEVPMVDEQGNPVLYKVNSKYGKRGDPRMTKIFKPTGEPDLKGEMYQLNRYRIFFEKYGFPISRMNIQAIIRDGNTVIARERGIERRVYVVPVPFMPDAEVLAYYEKLSLAVDMAVKTGKVRKCDSWESWEGRRCETCEVKEACDKMEEINAQNQASTVRIAENG